MYRILYVVLIGLAFLSISGVLFSGEVLGASTSAYTHSYSPHNVEVVTTTAFDQKEEIEYVTIPFDTQYEDDDEMEYGQEKVLREGVNGLKTLTYLVTFWHEDTIDTQLINTEIEDPVTEIVSKGTKIVWRLYSTPDVGRVKYWYKIRVWATKYDGNCYGCTGRTYSGTEVEKGVCATDPKVIPLGTNFYVDGYGLCRAEDIGGAIKGNKVDLGFVDASKSNWGAAWTDIYLLTNAPE